MKLIKYFLIGVLAAFNGLNFNFNSNNKKISDEHIISRTWSETSDTDWMNFDFNESNFIKSNKIIKSVEWQVAINAEYYGWSYSSWQSSNASNNAWFKERSTNGEEKYPFQIKVWRDWWSCGNSALNLEIKINNKWERLFKFQKTFGYCWKFSYSTGFEIKFKFNYEDQYQQQLDNFEKDITSKKPKISSPTADLDKQWIDKSGRTSLRNVIENDLTNKIIIPTFKKYKEKYKKNHIFKSIADFKKNIKIKKNGNNGVIATFKPKYQYDNTIYSKDITINYILVIDPNADYYQKQLNDLFKNINNNFKIKVASFSETESWKIGTNNTTIHNEIEKHLNGEIKKQITNLEQKNIDIFEFSKFDLKKEFKRLNNNQIKLTLKSIKYKWKSFDKEYEVLNDINIIYNLELDREYLKDDVDSRIKFFVNNAEQGRRKITINNGGKSQEILAFNEKVNLEFYPEAIDNSRNSILEELEIKSNTGKKIKIEEILKDDNTKYPRICKAVLNEPDAEIDDDGKLKDEVIYYNITVKKYDLNSNGEITGNATTIYENIILIKETNPGIQFEYTTDISAVDSDGQTKSVTNILPETVVYNEQLDEEIPELFSVETKNMLLDNLKVNNIFSNISSWMISTKSTKPIINKKEIPYIKRITEINDKGKKAEYDFNKDGLEKWENTGKAWTGIVNGYIEFQLESVFSNLSPKYTLYQFDEVIADLLDQIPRLKEKIIKETNGNKKKEYQKQLEDLKLELHNKMILLLKNKKSITSFWDSNLAKLIRKYYKRFKKEYFLEFTLQQTKILINEFIEWIKLIIFPEERDPLEDKEVEEMSDQEKADYLARRIIETFKNRNLSFSSKINDEIIFNDNFDKEIKKRITSWMSENSKALAILKDVKTNLKFKILDIDKTELKKIKIVKSPVTTILEIEVKYDTKNSIFIPAINLVFRVGDPKDDMNPDYKDPDDKITDDKDPDDKITDDKDPDDKITDDKVTVINKEIENDKISKRNLGIIIGSILGAGSIIVAVTVIFYIRKIKKIN